MRLQHGTVVAGIAAGDAYTFLAKDDDPESDQVSNSFGTKIDHHDEGDGIAPGAQIVFQNLVKSDCTTITMPYGEYMRRLLLQAYGPPETRDTNPTSSIGWTSARVHNNSWVSGTTGGYDLRASATDRATWELRDMVVTFCAGNFGQGFDEAGTDCGHAMDGSQHVMSDTNQAKNILAVGATNHAADVRADGAGEDVGCYSSHGPGDEPRIKPDLVAPGGSTGDMTDHFLNVPALTSTLCYATAYRRGTSFAAPSIAGLSLLVREYFRKGYYPTGVAVASNAFIPTSALIRAILINSTRNVPGYNTADVGTGQDERPTFGQGWGRPVLDDTLYFAGDPVNPGERSNLIVLNDVPTGITDEESMNDQGLRGRTLMTFEQALVDGDVQTYFVALPGPTSEPFHVTLNWTDVPSCGGASVALVNDLDLEVIDPDNNVWRPSSVDTGSGSEKAWAGGFSMLSTANFGVEALTRQQDAPPFDDFEARDAHNTTENIFIQPSDQIAGIYTIKVIGYSIDTTSPPLLAMDAQPNWNDGDGSTDFDPIDSTSQGYALVASGKVRPVVGPVIVQDGCEAGGADGLLDDEEVVNLFVPITVGSAESTVTACLEATEHSIGNIQIGGFGTGFPGATEATCDSLGDVSAGDTIMARFPVQLLGSHPDPPNDGVFSARFAVTLAAGGTTIGVFPLRVPLNPAFPDLSGATPHPDEVGVGGCTYDGAPSGAEPKISEFDEDADTLKDDLLIEFCPGQVSADVFNVYAGNSWSLNKHVAVGCIDGVDADGDTYADCDDDDCDGWANAPCNNGTWGDGPGSPPPLDADERCEIVLHSEATNWSGSRYYMITGEVDCGAEGPTGFNLAVPPAEYMYGGGPCSP